MIITQTSRLMLRTWRLDDLEAGLRIWGDEAVMRYVDEGRALSRDEVLHSLKAGIAHQEQYGFQHWAVIEKSTEEVVGSCGFSRFQGGRDLELVYHFCRASWGKGYATEAVVGALDYAKRMKLARQVMASADPRNIGSLKVLDKAGFLFIRKQYFEDTQQYEPLYVFELNEASSVDDQGLGLPNMI